MWQYVHQQRSPHVSSYPPSNDSKGLATQLAPCRYTPTARVLRDFSVSAKRLIQEGSGAYRSAGVGEDRIQALGRALHRLSSSGSGAYPRFGTLTPLEALPLTRSPREEIDRRLDESAAEGSAGLSWVKSWLAVGGEICREVPPSGAEVVDAPRCLLLRRKISDLPRGCCLCRDLGGSAAKSAGGVVERSGLTRCGWISGDLSGSRVKARDLSQSCSTLSRSAGSVARLFQLIAKSDHLSRCWTL